MFRLLLYIIATPCPLCCSGWDILYPFIFVFGFIFSDSFIIIMSGVFVCKKYVNSFILLFSPLMLWCAIFKLYLFTRVIICVRV